MVDYMVHVLNFNKHTVIVFTHDVFAPTQIDPQLNNL